MPHSDFAKCSSFDQTLRKAIDKYQLKLIVLTEFMRKLSRNFVNYYERTDGQYRSIPPSQISRALIPMHACSAAGDSEHGVSVHYATKRVDGGIHYLPR
ncbi:formyltransferase family protein [Coxiella-like endosymbiont]|uniref:formyltransferase family protein n=1 Tax=Coxiella-like endosymbiont TaxID=1592897 RepID=UPI00272AD326|nr:formyltransferase family protein [Coxiella-like endosymbiont]